MRLGFHADDDESETGGDMQSQGVTVDDGVGDIVERDRAERHARMKDVVTTCFVIGLAVGGFSWTAYQWFSFGDSGTSHAVYTLMCRYPIAAMTVGYLLADVQAFQDWLDQHRRLRWLAIGGVIHCVWPIFPW